MIIKVPILYGNNLKGLVFALILHNQECLSHLVQSKGLGDGKAPPSLKGSSDHCRAGSGRGRGKAKRVLKLQPTHLNAEVNEVNWGEKLGQLPFKAS